MLIDPVRWFRRRQRLLQEARDEMQYFRRRYGADAAAFARQALERPELSSWGRQVMARALKELDRDRGGA